MTEERRYYQSIEPVTEVGAEAAVTRNDPNELRSVVVGVGLYSEDLIWAEHYYLRLAHHEYQIVRGNALLAFGHLARRFRRLESSQSVDVVRHGLADQDEYIQGQAEDAADDIEWYAKLHVRGRRDDLL